MEHLHNYTSDWFYDTSDQARVQPQEHRSLAINAMSLSEYGASEVHPDILLSMVLDQSVALLDAVSAMLALYDPTYGDMVVRVARGPWESLLGARIPLDIGKSAQVLSTGEMEIWKAREAGVVWFGLSDPCNMIIGMPLRTASTTIGVIWAERRAFHQHETRMLARITDVATRTIAPLVASQRRVSPTVRDTRSCERIVGLWTAILALRDSGTDYHCQQATRMFVRLARRMGFSETELMNGRRGALLHDIGKLAIPDAILFKPGPLNRDEWEIMRQHPVYAYQMLSSIPCLQAALDIPYSHHERWDGTGYPRGLAGERIPLAARIFAVVDVWDALLSDRPYRKAWPNEQVCEYIRKQAGRHFDPHVVHVFLQLLAEDDHYSVELEQSRTV